MQKYLIKNIQVVNEGVIETSDVLITNQRIERIAPGISNEQSLTTEIDGEGKYLMPGAIDDQVHFREPGLTHKATIYTEAKAAVAGGVTSFMEMPNTLPPAFTLELLEQKYAIAANNSLANYSFFMGTSNENAKDALKANQHKQEICGIKIFMGASTGNLLVDNPNTLDKVFRESELLIATHCEDESIIRRNRQRINERGNIQPADHPVIRDAEVCYSSSLYAIQIAKKYDTRLHILHISTEKELALFTNLLPLKDKRISCEVCVHHLHFTSDDYERLGYQIKCNPAIKAPSNREGLWKALLDDRLDVIATDHAPHTLEEKGFTRNEDGQLVAVSPPVQYDKAHAGLPLVQHPMMLMLHYERLGKISLEKIAEKMSHAVATCFRIKERGFIREGYFADLVIIDPARKFRVAPQNLLYKCGWSPLEGFEFPASVTHTFVNGHLAFSLNDAGAVWNPTWDESQKGRRLMFDR